MTTLRVMAASRIEKELDTAFADEKKNVVFGGAAVAKIHGFSNLS